MKLDEVKSLFSLAGIPVLAIWELMNQYWPRPEIEDSEEGVRAMLRYGPLVIGNPWWLVKTPGGLIRIGWRKRVISIDWSDTAVRKVVTDDPVTKDEAMVHADNLQKALEYLTEMAKELRFAKPTVVT